MSKPDGSTTGPASSGQHPSPVATALTVAESTDRPPRPASRGSAVDPEGNDAPNRVARDPIGHDPRFGADLQAMIGQQLRAAYHEIVNEPVPDRFVRLLEELAAKAPDRR